MQLTEETKRISISESRGTMPTGMIRLDPVGGSLSTSSIDVVIDLSDPDGQLRFGDLRKAASKLDKAGEYESAHRLWRVVGTAAHKLGDVVVANQADRRAERSLGRAIVAKTKTVGRPAKFDYDVLAQDHAGGLSLAETARRHGCSITTIKRAIHYVRQRDQLLETAPKLVSEISSGTDVSELSQKYNVEPKVMRWIVVSYFDRRLQPRDT